MSSINSTIKDILSHPYWKTEEEREIYLFEFAMHIYEETCSAAAVVYRNNRRYTPTECFTAIKNMEPPTLNFWMKKAEPECIIVPILSISHKKPQRYINPLQLLIQFPEFTSVEALQA